MGAIIKPARVCAHLGQSIEAYLENGDTIECEVNSRSFSLVVGDLIDVCKQGNPGNWVIQKKHTRHNELTRTQYGKKPKCMAASALPIARDCLRVEDDVF